MKTLLVLPVLAMLGVAVLPEPATMIITGRITDAASGVPLAGAQVALEATTFGTISDADGRYRLVVAESLRGSTRVLTAQLIGYATARRSLRLDADSIRADLALRANAIALDEVKVGRDARLRAETAAHASVAAVAAAPPPPALMVPGLPGVPPEIRVRREPWNTESYALIEDNPFRAVRTNPLSTFSIDVDRASYSNVRRFIESGQLPPKDAVRIEELINYFHYTNPVPRGDAPLAVTTELMPAPWQPRHHLLRIALQARRIDTRELPPSNLVFLVDVSGSMTPPDKLPLLKQALQLLVHELRPEDRIALVVYAGSAGLVLESTPGSQKATILRALGALEAGGSTAGGAGIRLAYDIARAHHIDGGNNRVILATDGDFNVGVSSDAEMVRLIEEKRRQGTFLTVLGFGTGNLKDSKMEQLADHGNGNYAYIDDLREARKVLVTEMGGTLHTVAKDVKLQVEFNPARVRAYRLIGYENRMLAAEDFDDDSKDAGDVGAGHTVTALYELVPAGVTGTVDVRESGELRYQERDPTQSAGGHELAFIKLRYKQPDGATSRLMELPVRGSRESASADLRFAAAVAEFGMLLRASEHRGEATYEEVLALARGALGDDPEGYRREFVRLVETARALAGGIAAEDSGAH